MKNAPFLRVGIKILRVIKFFENDFVSRDLSFKILKLT